MLNIKLKAPEKDVLDEFRKGTGDRGVSTTMVLVRLLNKLMRDKEFGKFVVPIIPDEARTFGMEAMFRKFGIYSHVGQLYEPVDANQIMYYKEARDGAILEEGITEAGSMSSFIAAGTAYALHQTPMIPFFIYYSMFGFQRVGDLIWAAGDMHCRGFLVGGTAGRTTLMGEGLQHQDGHSHLLASTVPNLISYDPAFAFEIAVIVAEGIRRMYHDHESVFYYFTVGNEKYPQPEMPEGVEDGILNGAYKFRAATLPDVTTGVSAALLGSGSLLNHALEAQEILARDYFVAADVFSVTSYSRLRREAQSAERWNMLHPQEVPRVPYVSQVFGEEYGAFVAVSDYMKAGSDGISKWLPVTPFVLGYGWVWQE